LPTSAINTDAPEDFNLDLTGDSAVDDFLKRLVPTDAEKPSGSKDEDTNKAASAADEGEAPEAKSDDENSAEKPEDQSEEEAEEKTEDDAKEEEHKLADDETYVKIKVGDEEHEVPVKELQRLYGQEASLTKKSMEVAEQRKAVDAEMAKNVAASGALLERAKARFEPYSKIDFMLAAKELSAEDYTNLRTAAQAAYEDVQFLEQNLNGFMQAAAKRQHDDLVKRAGEALQVLQGPVEKGGVEGWNEQVYNNVRSFAVEAGLDNDLVNNIVDPVAIKLLHDAMLFRRGQSKVITKKINKTPTKVIKTTKAPETGSPGDKSKVNAALKRLSKTGSTDDAADAFMARWASNDAE
jgi:hypothetical protein